MKGGVGRASAPSRLVLPPSRRSSAGKSALEACTKGTFSGGCTESDLAFEAEVLQQLVDIGEIHQDFTRLASLVAPDDAVVRQLVDDSPCPRVAHVELALDKGHRGAALGGDGAGGTGEQGVQAALRGAIPAEVSDPAAL